MKAAAEKAVKNVVAAYTYEDPISEKAGRNRRNAMIVSGLSLLHYWNPVQLTGFGFKLENSDAGSIASILLALLSYLSLMWLLNITSDFLASVERINASDVQQTNRNWDIAVKWAEALKEVNEDGTIPPDKGYVKANLEALNKKIPEMIALEEQYRRSVKRAKFARVARTVGGDILVPLAVILAAFVTLGIRLFSNAQAV